MDSRITQLQAATHTFHLLHHRNKNQHQHSSWWKWFSMLKRCVSKLIHEFQARDQVRAQARVRYINQILLPKCYASFTQLIQDTQFSTLGLTLVAELSRMRRLLAPYADPIEDKLGSATELTDSRDTVLLNLSEDVGEAVGRIKSSDSTNVGLYPVLPIDILNGPERLRGAAKCLYEREGAGLDATKAAKDETERPRPKAGAVIAGLESCASPAPIKRLRRKKSVNAIDDLFQGLY